MFSLIKLFSTESAKFYAILDGFGKLYVLFAKFKLQSKNLIIGRVLDLESLIF